MKGINIRKLGLEKRRYVRVRVSVDVLFRFAADRRKCSYRAVTKNMSQSGACLEVYQDQEEVLRKIGNDLPEMEVSINLSDDRETAGSDRQTAWIKCTLDWLAVPREGGDPVTVGIAFTGLGENDEDRINGLIAHQLLRK